MAPWARLMANVLVSGGGVFVRSFARAYEQVVARNCFFCDFKSSFGEKHQKKQRLFFFIRKVAKVQSSVSKDREFRWHKNLPEVFCYFFLPKNLGRKHPISYFFTFFEHRTDVLFLFSIVDGLRVFLNTLSEILS